MKLNMKKLFGTLFLTFAVAFMFAQGNIEGIWYNTTKTGKVKIFKKGDSYYGKIIWLKEPLSEKTGKPKTDENNPESKYRSNPIIGLEVLQNFVYDDGKFVDGTIYDPENGKTYKCKMTLTDANNLDVRGYIGIPALGRTEKWTRTKE